MEFIDYYKILGINKNASEEEIRKHTANLRANIIPTLIQMIKKPIKNFNK